MTLLKKKSQFIDIDHESEGKEKPEKTSPEKDLTYGESVDEETLPSLLQMRSNSYPHHLPKKMALGERYGSLSFSTHNQFDIVLNKKSHGTAKLIASVYTAVSG